METKKKKKLKWVDVKITHDSIMGKLFTGSSFDIEEGELLRAVVVTKEMAKKYHLPGEGYSVPPCRFIIKNFATTKITKNDYKKYLKKLLTQFETKISEKTEIDKELNRLSKVINYYGKKMKGVINV